MSDEVLARKQYEDIIINSQPFWYIRLLTRHYCKMLICAYFFYFLAAYACVTLGLVELDALRNEDFFIQSQSDTKNYFTHERFKVQRQYAYQAEYDQK